MVSLFDGGTCGGIALVSDTEEEFSDEGLNSNADFEPNTAAEFTVNADYGTATSDCSDAFTYLRLPETPTLLSTDPASGSNVNTPKLKGSAQNGVTINIYAQAACAGAIAATGTEDDFEAAGLQVTVPDNSTTTFSAEATGVGGDSVCSNTLSYTETTPSPVNPTPTPTTPKKCKKGFVKKKGKCVKKKKKKKKKK
jgi:hypothetical protein